RPRCEGLLLDRSKREVSVARKTAVLVDPDPRWLKAAEQLLGRVSVEVVAKTTSLSGATRLVQELRPDLVVIEVAMREGATTGLSWLATTRKRELKLIALSAAADPTSVAAALEAGADVHVV